jgi:hypothetical protein
MWLQLEQVEVEHLFLVVMVQMEQIQYLMLVEQHL